MITGGRRGVADELWLPRQDTVQRWIETERGDWPAWSPDSDRIAYALISQPPELVVRSVNGSGARTITSARGISQLSWTANSEGLVYAIESAVWFAPLDGGAPEFPCRVVVPPRDVARSPRLQSVACSIVRGRFRRNDSPRDTRSTYLPPVERRCDDHAANSRVSPRRAVLSVRSQGL